MAELTKKLHFKKNGTEHTAKAYSTVDEAGETYSKLKIDGIACYAPLGDTDDAMATVGRVKSAVKYFKYIDVAWTQPILTSNGTMGTSDFATSASSVVDNVRQAYRAFDGSNKDTETDCWHSASGTTGWLSWYSKTPIKIQMLTISNRDAYNGDVANVHSPKGWELQVSENGSSWNTLVSGTNNVTGGYETWNIVIPESSQVYSSYWRLNILSSNGTYLCIGEIQITATTQSTVEVSSNEVYDYTTGGDIFAIKSQSKPPYTEVSYTTTGTHTFTVPAGITRLRVAVCGGGGGFAQAYTTTNRTHKYTAGSGDSSSFGSLMSATGGGGSSLEIRESSIEAYSAGTGGSPNGRAGTANTAYNSYSYGGTGFALSFTMQNGSYGYGGYCSQKFTSMFSPGGGSGGYNTGYVNVTPNTAYTIKVGSGGSNKGYSTVYNAINATSGFVLIAYGGDI